KIKGSEVGFSWAKIDKILNLKEQLEANVAKHKEYESGLQLPEERTIITATQRLLYQTKMAQIENSPFISSMEGICKVLDELLKPDYTSSSVAYEFTYEGYKRRQKKLTKRRGLSH
ncbi:MAG: hypothetical protein K2X37_07655, partial [Chitinophagaceae bacterium]|nr:hypothetical protein [Chitinophagaceae bacterium]